MVQEMKNTIPFSIKSFKEEFRMICADTWGDACEAWFEAVGQMNKRGLPIPSKYEYNAGKDFQGSNDKGTCPDSYWHEMFENSDTEDLVKIAEYLFRYCDYLRFKGIDY